MRMMIRSDAREPFVVVNSANQTLVLNGLRSWESNFRLKELEFDLIHFSWEEVNRQITRCGCLASGFLLDHQQLSIEIVGRCEVLSAFSELRTECIAIDSDLIPKFALGGEGKVQLASGKVSENTQIDFVRNSNNSNTAEIVLLF
ncbi:MAG: hypothetical protein R3E66_22625 [bacterium]